MQAKGFFTNTNIKCKHGHEIDLLATNVLSFKCLHVESRVSTALKLKEKATINRKTGKLNKNGLDYFNKEKFEHPYVKEKIHQLFGQRDYEKWLVVWDCDILGKVVSEAYQKYGIEIKFMRDLIDEMIWQLKILGSRDDILRTLELITKLDKERKSLQRTFDGFHRRRIPFDLKCSSCGSHNRIYVRETYVRNNSETKATSEVISVYLMHCRKCKKEIAIEGEIFRDGLNGNLI